MVGKHREIKSWTFIGWILLKVNANKAGKRVKCVFARDLVEQKFMKVVMKTMGWCDGSGECRFALKGSVRNHFWLKEFEKLLVAKGKSREEQWSRRRCKEIAEYLKTCEYVCLQCFKRNELWIGGKELLGRRLWTMAKSSVIACWCLCGTRHPEVQCSHDKMWGSVHLDVWFAEVGLSLQQKDQVAGMERQIRIVGWMDVTDISCTGNQNFDGTCVGKCILEEWKALIMQ